MAKEVVGLHDRNWFGDARVKSSTAEEKVAWLEILRAMGSAEKRGVLRRPLSRIASIAGTSIEVVQALVDSGLLKGHDGASNAGGRSDLPFVYRANHAGRLGEPEVLIEDQDGPLWYVDWMVRDNHRSEKARRGVRASLESQVPRRPVEAKVVQESQEIGRVGPLPNCPHARLVELYHGILPAGKRVVLMGPDTSVAKALKSRWRALAVAPETEYTGYRAVEDGLQKWKGIFELAARSRFLTGQVPSRGDHGPFELSLAWMLGPKNLEKVLNGHFHRDGNDQTTPVGTQSRSRLADSVMNGVDRVMAMQRNRQVVMPLDFCTS